ncbi:hypothetical protein CK203_088142 [Vitis vinifera]|uniref:Reverse transcriptase zinc-binding domain-containing protein n=1 Tax=Vitis vinifera TaxID=29760 RepID=A0A438DPD4_VITVI|nr:hypothetical protein CK203_088142 [Vitis vinifera]
MGRSVVGGVSREVRDGYGVGPWKAIRKLGNLVSSRISFVVGNGQRVSFWKDKPFNDWEINEMENLLLCLSGKRVIADEDRVRWVESKDDIFSVKSLYKALELDSTRCFPMKIIWNSSAQPKVSFFVWEAS